MKNMSNNQLKNNQFIENNNYNKLLQYIKKLNDKQ